MHWPSQESAESRAQDRAPLDRLGVILFHNLFLILSPSWYLIEIFGGKDGSADRTKRDRAIATCWVLFVTAGLLVMWRVNPGDSTTRLIFGVLAGWRLIEIFTVGLGIVLNQSESLLGHSLVTIAFLGAHLVLIFAILDHSFAATGFVLQQGAVQHIGSSPSDYLYISWTDMVTVGNAYDILSDAARWLTMVTSTAGVLLLAVFVASAISRLGQAMAR